MIRCLNRIHSLVSAIDSFHLLETLNTNYLLFVRYILCIAGRWHVKNIKPTANGEPQEVKIKVRINNNGIILVTSANVVDKKAIKVDEPATPTDNGDNGNKMDVQEVSFTV